MGDVVQLRRVFDKDRQHCDDCGRDLPDMRKVSMREPVDMKGATLTHVHFDLTCKCGTEWIIVARVAQ
jgi:hypothetical protein